MTATSDPDNAMATLLEIKQMLEAQRDALAEIYAGNKSLSEKMAMTRVELDRMKEALRSMGAPLDQTGVA